jgi:hypothetical protein
MPYSISRRALVRRPGSAADGYRATRSRVGDCARIRAAVALLTPLCPASSAVDIPGLSRSICSALARFSEGLSAVF